MRRLELALDNEFHGGLIAVFSSSYSGAILRQKRGNG